MVKLAMYCPNCGHHGIWQDEEDPGDYYAGTAMWCFECKSKLSDIAVYNPWDERQGKASVEWAVDEYERHRKAAGK